MKRNFFEICFSPTGGTKAVSEILTDRFCIADSEWNLNHVDLLKMVRDGGELPEFTAEDVCLISVPSFAGRVPLPAAEKLAELRGNGAKAILNVVFGNRAIDDTLLELRDVLEEAGFVCVAAMETVAEHSIFRQFGAGRPDAVDREELHGFAEQVLDELHLDRLEGKLQVPGNYPYRERKPGSMIPVGGERCSSCKLCVFQCPVHAIPSDRPESANSDVCIGCMRCVSVCPSAARDITTEIREKFLPHMTSVCSGRKENRLYLERAGEE